ncbi:hypothetical protein [Clostridium sp. JNZ J1-5]
MKNKKIISIVLTAGMLLGGIGVQPIKAMAATGESVQAETKVNDQELKTKAYELLKQIRVNPNEKDIKEARKILTNISDQTYKSGYSYLLGLYIDRNIDKNISPMDELLKAYGMNQNITSAEQQMQFDINLKGENLSEDEKAMLAQILPIINTFKMGIDAKSKTSDENKKAQVEGNIKISINGMPIEMKTWADVDATAKVPKVKYVVEIPEAAKAFMPDGFKDKKYFVYDLEKILAEAGDIQGQMPNFGAIMNDAEVFGKKFMAATEDFMKLADAKYDIVSRGDLTKIDPSKAKDLSKLYKVELTNDKLIQIIKDALQDEKMMKMIKDYVNSTMEMDPSTKGQKIDDKEFKEGLNEVVKALDKMKDGLKFDLVYECGVNKEGYISYEKGSIKVTVNTAKLEELMGQVPGQLPGVEANGKSNSTYTLTMNFDSNSTNINKDIKMSPMPEVNEKNSVDFMQLMELAGGMQGVNVK